MNVLKFKKLPEESIFGDLFTLWTAPIDSPKLDTSHLKKTSKDKKGWFLSNSIVSYKF